MIAAVTSPEIRASTGGEPPSAGRVLDPPLAPAVAHLVCAFREAFDPARFDGAFRRVIARHAALQPDTTATVVGGREAFERATELALVVHDLRLLPRSSQDPWVTQDVAAARDVAFAVGSRRMHRIAAYRLEEAEWYVVWTFARSALDARAVRVVLGEVLACYDALPGDRLLLAEPRGVDEFQAAIDSRVTGADEQFWQRLFASRDPRREAAADATPPTRWRATLPLALSLGPALTHRIAAAAAAIDVKVSTVVAGAWALALGARARTVVLGVGVTPRPEPHDLFADCVARCVRDVPLPVGVPSQARVAEWLRALRALQLDTREHASAPMTDVHRWAGLAEGAAGLDAQYSFDVDSLQAAMDARRCGEPRRTFELLEEPGHALSLSVQHAHDLTFQLRAAVPAYQESYVSLLLRAVAGFAIALSEAPLAAVAEVRPVPVNGVAISPFGALLHRDLPSRSASLSADP